MFNKAAVQAALRAKAAVSLAAATRATESRIVGLARSQVEAFQAERVVVRAERAAAVAASSVAVSAVASDVLSDAAAKRMPGKWWNARCTDHIKYHTKREEKELNTMMVRDRDEVYMNADENTGCEGDLRLNRLNYYLNNRLETFTNTELRERWPALTHALMMVRCCSQWACSAPRISR